MLTRHGKDAPEFKFDPKGSKLVQLLCMETWSCCYSYRSKEKGSPGDVDIVVTNAVVGDVAF
jgi:hypothetical protein